MVDASDLDWDRLLRQKLEEYRLVARDEVKTAYLAKQKQLYEAGDKAGKMLAWLGSREREGETVKGSARIAEEFANYKETSILRKERHQ